MQRKIIMIMQGKPQPAEKEELKTGLRKCPFKSQMLLHYIAYLPLKIFIWNGHN